MGDLFQAGPVRFDREDLRKASHGAAGSCSKPPILADVIRGAMLLLGVALGALLLSASTIVGPLVGGLIGISLVIGWRRHRRRKVLARTG